MTKKEFIETMAAKTGAPKADMEVTVDALLDVISDTLIQLEQAFPSDISTAHGLWVCRPQVYNSIYAKSTGDVDATALQEAPFAQNDTLVNGGAPISFDATAGQIDFTLSQ